MTKKEKLIESKEKIKEKKSWLYNFFAHRQHPIKILTYTTKYLWLLLIPLGKYLIAMKFDFQSWIRANWVDILTISVIIGYAFLRWIFVFYEVEEDCIIAHTGYFGISKTRVYFSEMSSMSLCQGYIYRAIHACTLYIDTDAKSLQEADIKLDLSTKRAMEIYGLATKKCRGKPRYVFNSSKLNLVIFSLLFSSTLSGVILVLSVIYEAYRIVGREAEELFLEKVSTEIEKLAVYIPKYFLVSGIVIAGGWLVSFISNLMRHWNFSCTRCADMFLIESGKGTKRRHVLMRDRINSVDYQQSMLMKFFKICSVAVQCTGYGKRRLEISALIPITTNDDVDHSMKALMPGIPPVRSQVRTGRNDLQRFITLPIVYCLIPPCGAAVLKYFFPLWTKEIRIFLVIIMIPLIWFVAVRFVAAFTTSIGFTQEHCTISYCKLYGFHKTVIRNDKICKVTVSQNPFQKISRTCNVRIYSNSESLDKHVIRGLNYRKVKRLLNNNGYIF